ncbi:MAG: hypothetical protein KDI19_08315 [Pseudomonadales bacterium]|nr:hypothetical protein [Pseudomonadales bacterium]
MQYQNETFKGERIDLDGKMFHGCTFESCELVFSGDRPPTFSDNRFVDTVFVMTGHATRTMYLLSNIYHAGDGGRQVVEDIFDELRAGNIHGKEITTKVPNTKDHSMA